VVGGGREGEINFTELYTILQSCREGERERGGRGIECQLQYKMEGERKGERQGEGRERGGKVEERYSCTLWTTT
jgi:hypothetical protein